MVRAGPEAALGELLLLGVELLVAVLELLELLELLLELLQPVSAAATPMTTRRTQPVTGVLNFIVPPRCVVGLVADWPGRRG
jgi:hypothetical protein